MLISKISSLKNLVINSKKSTLDNFKELLELLQAKEYSVEERSKCTIEFARAFWSLCVYYPQETTFQEVKIIEDLVNILNVASVSLEQKLYQDKERMFVSLLYSLLHRDEVYEAMESKEFVEFYGSLFDVIEEVKWLFALRDATGKKIFPIQKLIEDVANTFKLDQEHYLQLVFSLELFNYTDLAEEDSDRNRVKEKMLEIAKEYNILLIEMLCEGGSVLYMSNAAKNSTLNGTIIVSTDEKILIRNPQKSYFTSFYDKKLPV